MTDAQADMVLESPLIVIGAAPRRELSVDGRGCVLAELPFMDIVNLRGDAADDRFVQSVRAATALDLPTQANTASVAGTRQLIWLGPDEWLLKDADSADISGMGAGTGASGTANKGLTSPLAESLRAALAQHAGLHHSVVEVGSGNTTVTRQAAGAADLLSRG